MEEANRFLGLIGTPEDIGTHSFRKGGVTYVLSFPGGPNSVSAYMRARWSLGIVQQRYVFEGDGSDQFCGRVACGLPMHSSNEDDIGQNSYCYGSDPCTSEV